MSASNRKLSSSRSKGSNSSETSSKHVGSRRTSAAASNTSSASSGPAISVDGLRASEIETTVEWAMTETIMGSQIRDITFQAGPDRVRDLLLLDVKGYGRPKKHTDFTLAKDRLEFATLLNIMRGALNGFGVKDSQNKAKREFLARFPHFRCNRWGSDLRTSYIEGRSQAPRRTSQTPLSAIPGTAEWWGKQKTKTTPIKDIVKDANDMYLLLRTADGDFHSTTFLRAEDTKVLANFKNIQDYLPEHRATAKEKFLRKYSAVEYNEGQKMLVLSPNTRRRSERPPRKLWINIATAENYDCGLRTFAYCLQTASRYSSDSNSITILPAS